MANPFSSPGIAKAYAKFRITYPATIYDKVFQFLDAGSDLKLRKLAIDVGCGSGQNTKVLANSFEKVLAVDASEAQVKEARTACSEFSNITFSVGSAEELDGLAEEGSVDLVTVATALHFFGAKPFFEACHRVLRRGGVFAAYSYHSINLDKPEADKASEEVCLRLSVSFFRGTLLDYYDERVAHHLFSNRYQDYFSTMATIFPVTERWSQTELAQKRSLRQLMGFVQSMASYEALRKQNPNLDDPLKDLQAKLHQNSYKIVAQMQVFRQYLFHLTFQDDSLKRPKQKCIK